LFPTPRLMKLPPVPAWSPKALTARPAGLAAATASPAVTDVEPAAWGICEIVLAADQGKGATHKFFHDWRFEAVMREGEPAPETVLALSPIAPRRSETVAAVTAPVSLIEQFHAAAPNPQTPFRATFAWTLPTNRAVPDPNQPLVFALERLRQRLREAGWQPEDAASPRYRKSAPAGQGVGRFPSSDPDQTGHGIL
jgi:hypothetical protein